MATDLKKLIEEAWEDRKLLESNEYINAIETVIERLDKGEARVAELIGNRWHTNEWMKKAVILYFPTRHMEEVKVGPFVFPRQNETENRLQRNRCKGCSACYCPLRCAHCQRE